jgi:hypothetical protein
MMQIVKMTNGDLEGTATASAFQNVWKERGWSLAEGEKIETGLDDATQAELADKARTIGIEGRSTMSKQELKQAVEQSGG